MNYFEHIQQAPPDPILGINQAFNACKDSHKINLSVGAYRDEDGKPWVLSSVKAAEDILHAQHQSHEYLPIIGDAKFIESALQLAYGDDQNLLKRVAGVQSLSGTGALRLAGEFLARHMTGAPAREKLPKVYCSNPTWSNHFQIFEHCGFEVGTYTYWDPKHKNINFEQMCADLRGFDNGSIIIFHAVSHNPTGIDPTLEQWAVLSKLCLEKQHFVLFDCAYQGFASGDANKDIQSVRLFLQDGHNFALCQSFAKNFGLYGERVGLCSFVAPDEDKKKLYLSQMAICARTLYSNPPAYGAKIVSIILHSPELTEQWHNDIKLMSDRITKMRYALRDALTNKYQSKLNWDHIVKQIGMFSYTGLNKEQCQHLIDEYSIYLTLNGRISLAGLNEHNVDRVAMAIHNVTKDQVE